MEYWPWKKFSLVAQISGHTSPYGTGMRALDDDSLQILIGIKYRILKDLTWRISFTEDIGGVTGSDFTFIRELFFHLE